MAEYIKREDILKRLEEEACDCELIPLLLTPTAADVVEVVRCKECKWYNKRMCWHPKWDYICDIPPTMLDFDFCRYGERRDDDG